MTNAITPGAGYVPGDTVLSEGHINGALRTIWEASGNKPDLIVCGGGQKRRINGFIQTTQRFAPENEVFKNTVSLYESDFGVCRVVLSRYVPADSVLFLDSSRVSVLPLAGRSFQFKPLATTGDYESGEVLGEYTVELRNEKGHGVLSGLDG
ncbi:MAG: SU10 major capsid protein [Phycisphaerae bacterium]